MSPRASYAPMGLVVVLVLAPLVMACVLAVMLLVATGLAARDDHTARCLCMDPTTVEVTR